MNSVFDRLAAAENQFIKSQFVVPVISSPFVTVKISGVILSLKIDPPNYRGWGVFKPLDYKCARFVKNATSDQCHDYLKSLPLVRLVVCHKNDDGTWTGIQSGKGSINLVGIIPVTIMPFDGIDDIQLFDTIIVRYTGLTALLEGIDRNRDPIVADTLRTNIANELDPTKIDVKGILPEETEAYRIAFFDVLNNKRDRDEDKISEALQRAGATYRSYIIRGDSYTVEYTINGEQFKSTIDKKTLGVQAAGICLDGTDRVFDLQSLVSVIKEGQRRRLIHHVGLRDNWYEDDE